MELYETGNGIVDPSPKPSPPRPNPYPKPMEVKNPKFYGTGGDTTGCPKKRVFLGKSPVRGLGRGLKIKVG